MSRNIAKWNASKSSFETRGRASDLLQLVIVTKCEWEADHVLFCQSLDIYSPGRAEHAMHARVCGNVRVMHESGGVEADSCRN